MVLTLASTGAGRVAAVPAPRPEPLEGEALRALGTTLVVAPHPDDESLACGGLMARLGDEGIAVAALLITDGTLSHPGSRRYDARARAALRDAEWDQALSILGVASERRSRLGLVDGDVPLPGDPRFEATMWRCAAAIDRFGPKTVVAPWRRDAHPDHRATYVLIRAALARRRSPLRLLEYAVWATERGAPEDLPRAGEMRILRLDIGSGADRKRRAIAAHRSQLGEVITDDPNGFTIAPAMRERAERSAEHFLEALA